jgi:hypothetical protein
MSFGGQDGELGPRQNHTHIGTNYHSEDERMMNIFSLVPFFLNRDVQVHHFKVRKCGPLSPSIFWIPSTPFYFHENNQFPPIKGKVTDPLRFFESFNINPILELGVHLIL